MAETTNINTFAGNIDLSGIRKKRFTIDSNEDRVLELDTSDLSILNRLSEAYPKLEKLTQDMTKLGEGTKNTEESIKEDIDVMAGQLKEIDNAMRELVDYIFDSNVSEMCAPSGSMYDPIGGKFRYEHIMSVLTTLYEEGIGKEMDKITKRMKSHTGKYTKKK